MINYNLRIRPDGRVEIYRSDSLGASRGPSSVWPDVQAAKWHLRDLDYAGRQIARVRRVYDARGRVIEDLGEIDVAMET